MTDDIRLLPQAFEDWFAARGWAPRPHQLDCLRASRAGRSHLLIAPTGGGKPLAGFLPSLVDLHEKGSSGALHTLYVSPLKALAVDIARNVERPVADMNLSIRIEARTGDTPAHRRQRQKYAPPDMLLTTPEQVSLLLSHSDAGKFFSGLNAIIVDELHSFHATKRGHLLALDLSRLRTLAPPSGQSACRRRSQTLRRCSIISPAPQRAPISFARPAARSRKFTSLTSNGASPGPVILHATPGAMFTARSARRR